MNEVADVVVVGAGIIGLNAAFQIARRSSLRVIVVEKGAAEAEPTGLKEVLPAPLLRKYWTVYGAVPLETAASAVRGLPVTRTALLEGLVSATARVNGLPAVTLREKLSISFARSVPMFALSSAQTM